MEFLPSCSFGENEVIPKQFFFIIIVIKGPAILEVESLREHQEHLENHPFLNEPENTVLLTQSGHLAEDSFDLKQKQHPLSFMSLSPFVFSQKESLSKGPGVGGSLGR